MTARLIQVPTTAAENPRPWLLLDNGDAVPAVGIVISDGSLVDPATPSLGASEAHIGQVGGHITVKRPTITVQASPDYSDGDSIGGLITLSNFARMAAGSGSIPRFTLRSAINITVGMFVHIFDANPTASTFTDNSALVIHANDKAKLLKTVAILSTDWVAPKGASPWYSVELIGPKGLIDALDYELASGRDLYFALEADGTINYGATDDMMAIVAGWNN